MNEEQVSQNEPNTPTQGCDWKKHFCTVTPFSKYLALALFVALPFFGFWLGVQLRGPDDCIKGPVLTGVEVLCPNTDSCCRSSYEIAKNPSFIISNEKDSCPEGYMPNMLRCESSLHWCEPLGAKSGIDTNQETKFSVGDYIDMVVEITVVEEETGGEETYFTVGMSPKEKEESDVGFMIGGLGDKVFLCVDPELQTGGIARLRGVIKGVTPGYVYSMSCDDSRTNVAKLTTNTESWGTFTSEEFSMSFKYPSTFVEQPNTDAGTQIVANDGKGTTLVLSGTAGVHRDFPDLSGELITVDGTQGYLYYYREGAGYSGVLLLKTEAGTLSLSYDAIGTDKSESEIQKEFQQIITTIDL